MEKSLVKRIINCKGYFKNKRTLSEIKDTKKLFEIRKDTLGRKEREYGNLLMFLCGDGEDEWDMDINIYKEQELLNFKVGKNKNLNTIWTTTNEFFNTFEKLGVKSEEFEECFISAKYIDEEDLGNEMLLLVRISDMIERFMVQVG